MVEHAEAIQAEGLQALSFAMCRTGVGGVTAGLVMAALIFLPSIGIGIGFGFLAGLAWFVLSVPIIAVTNNLRAKKKSSR